MNKQPKNLEPGDILYENAFQEIRMINSNYPFTHMKCNGVVVLPFDDEGNIYVLDKVRPNIGRYYELPRGGLEEMEEYVDGGVRELFEETGMEPITIVRLGEVQPDTGLMKHKIQLIGIKVDKINEKIYKHYDIIDKEENTIVKMSVNDLFTMINCGKIVDGYTMSGLCKYLAYDKNNEENREEKVNI